MTMLPSCSGSSSQNIIDSNIERSCKDLPFSFTYLAQSLDKSHNQQPPQARISSHGHQKSKHRIDEHSNSQEIDVAVCFAEDSSWNLCDDVAVEESGENVRLDIGFPLEFSVGFWVMMVLQENGHRQKCDIR